MRKCKHSRTESIYISRRYITVQEREDTLWHDYIAGIKCRDCKDEMPMPAEMITTHYPYRGKPHYPVKNCKEKQEKPDENPGTVWPGKNF